MQIAVCGSLFVLLLIVVFYHYPYDGNRITVETTVDRFDPMPMLFPSSPRVLVYSSHLSSRAPPLDRAIRNVFLFVCLYLAFVVPPNASSLMESALVMTKTLRAESALSSSDVVRCGVSYTCAHTCHEKNISVSCPRPPRAAPRRPRSKAQRSTAHATRATHQLSRETFSLALALALVQFSISVLPVARGCTVYSMHPRQHVEQSDYLCITNTRTAPHRPSRPF